MVERRLRAFVPGGFPFEIEVWSSGESGSWHGMSEGP